MRRRQPILATLALAALAAAPGCAGDEAAGRLGAGGGPEAAASRAAVEAFARICGRLERAAVLGEASRFGFVPARGAGVPPAALGPLEARGVTLLVRRAPGSGAMLFWDETPPHCELTVSGVDPAAVEREFGRLLARLEAAPDLAVARASPEQMRALEPGGNALPLAALAVVAPRALVAATPSAVSLRLPPPGQPRRPVAMIARAAVPGAGGGAAVSGAMPAAPPSQLKDFPP